MHIQLAKPYTRRVHARAPSCPSQCSWPISCFGLGGQSGERIFAGGVGEKGVCQSRTLCRRGCIKIHMGQRQLPEYWSAHRSCPAAPRREKKTKNKNVHTGVHAGMCIRVSCLFIIIGEKRRRLGGRRVGNGRVGENTEREMWLHKAVVSLMWCRSHDRKAESERMSIYDCVGADVGM